MELKHAPRKINYDPNTEQASIEDRLAGFEARIAKVRTGRRMFRMQKPPWHRTSFFTLRQCTVYLLHPLDSSDYQLVGESFVHGLIGLIHGEAVRSGEIVL